MTRDDEAPRHRIGAVARLTGISTHALRVWERRYGTLHPKRSEGGDRLYSDGDVHRLRAIKRLLGLGHAIGDVARLGSDELDRLMEMHVEPKREVDPSGRFVERYLGHIQALDLGAAEQVLAGAALALPRREFIDLVLVPLLHEIGARWQDGALHVAHEHAATAMVRSQLGAMLRLFAPDSGASTVVATTPEGEAHELGALMAAVVAAMSGWRALYLGPNLPAREIAEAARTSGAAAVLLSIVDLSPAVGGARVEALVKALPAHTSVVVGGARARAIESLPRAVVRVCDLGELEAWLVSHGAPAPRSRARG